jgi:serine/threonine-protein kinase RsbT
LNPDRLPIRAQNDIVIVRRTVRELSIKLGFGLVDQTKITTAASELARNTLDYGLGGEIEIESLINEQGKPGIKMSFVDSGPGIADLDLALTDGYTSGRGLGMGLSGSKRLMNEFSVDTTVGKGTRVTVIKWK